MPPSFSVDEGRRKMEILENGDIKRGKVRESGEMKRLSTHERHVLFHHETRQLNFKNTSKGEVPDKKRRKDKETAVAHFLSRIEIGSNDVMMHVGHEHTLVDNIHTQHASSACRIVEIDS